MGKNNEVGKALAAFSHIALMILSPVMACLIIGKFLVDKFNFPQITIVILIVLGAVSGIYSMIKYILNITKSK